jgi:hypothetical protein
MNQDNKVEADIGADDGNDNVKEDQQDEMTFWISAMSSMWKLKSLI